MNNTLGSLFRQLAHEQHKRSFHQILKPDVFVSQVLVPEAACILIKEDLGLSDEEAYETLCESRAFGMALHPQLDVDE